jgi:UDP-N-acetylmuramoyl-L-alanyl-D-glutamate--2,6-diaminopimelate ligase
MKEGLSAADLKKIIEVVDRRQALNTAAILSQSGDVVLVAGKGHEDYQDVKGVKHHFDDKKVVREVMK